jgi:hypothetical protein
LQSVQATPASVPLLVNLQNACGLSSFPSTKSNKVFSLRAELALAAERLPYACQVTEDVA